MALGVSELLAKKETIPHESATLEEVEEAILSSGVFLVTGTLGAFSLDLARLGGIGTCPGPCRFASLLI